MGLNYTYDGNTYYPRYDGTTRIKISEKVANARSKITFNTGTSKLSTDEYTILIESFGSYDGIYYGPESSKQLEIKLNLLIMMIKIKLLLLILQDITYLITN